MEQSQIAIDFELILERLHYFFPADNYSIGDVRKKVLSKTILYKPEQLEPLLQTALFDEKLVELVFDDGEELYYTKIVDYPPGYKPGKENESVEETFSYLPGKYFTRHTHILTLPLEPGIGNYRIRNTNRIVLRFLTKAHGVEFGTYFRTSTSLMEYPVLEFDYPVIGRLLSGAREYRAKVTGEIDLLLHVAGTKTQAEITTTIADLSVSGLAFVIPKNFKDSFTLNEKRSFSILENGERIFDIKGRIVHITPIRKPLEVIYYCGVELEPFLSRDIAQMESLLARVQRAHLQSISGLSRETGFKPDL